MAGAAAVRHRSCRRCGPDRLRGGACHRGLVCGGRRPRGPGAGGRSRRGLALHAAGTTRSVAGLLNGIGRDDLAVAWAEAGGADRLALPGAGSGVDLYGDLRPRVLGALTNGRRPGPAGSARAHPHPRSVGRTGRRRARLPGAGHRWRRRPGYPPACGGRARGDRTARSRRRARLGDGRVRRLRSLSPPPDGPGTTRPRSGRLNCSGWCSGRGARPTC